MKNVLKYKVYDYKTLDKGIAVDENPNIASAGHAEQCFNFSYKDGGLKDGLGIGEIKYKPYESDVDIIYSLPDTLKPIKIFQLPYYSNEIDFRERMIIFLCEDGRVYGWKPNKLSDGTISLPFKINKHGIILHNMYNDETYIYALSDSKLHLYNLDTEVYQVQEDNVPQFEELCFYENRVFAIVRDKKQSIWYSDQKNPTNWLVSDAHSFINFDDLKGNCLKIKCVNDGIYVFREYGISKIIYNQNDKGFQVEELYQSTGKIYANSIQECGENFIYLTSDGLYAFNGISSKRLKTRIEDILRKNFNAFSLTAYNNGQYYIAMKIDIEDNLYEDKTHFANILIQLDLNSMSENILRGEDIIEITSVNESNHSFMFAITKDGESNRVGLINGKGKIFNKSTKKYWKSVESDYDLPHKKKILTRFFIVSKSDINITFNGDGKSKKFHIKGSENIQILKPNISAYRLSVEIESESIDHDITNLKGMVGYYD